jgi:ATP-dependent RNA helicase RhlE
MSFSALGLSAAVCTPLVRLGFDQPTAVQAQTIPLALEGRDVLVRAQTGTGKTAAFGLPMIERFKVRQPKRAISRRPRGLVLVPTRELAMQVQQALVSYGTSLGLRVVTIVGGVPGSPQARALQQGPDVVVATPGRLIDHLDRGTVDLSDVEVLVLDEADRMLDMGFLPPLRTILADLPDVRQTLLLSATLGPEVMRLAHDVTQSPARVDVTPKEIITPSVAHHAHPAPEGRKGELLAHVLRQVPTDQAIVFCKTKHGSNRVAEFLERSGVKAAVIHGNKSQPQRDRALNDFKARRAMVLVATDVASRGLDIKELGLVVNYDLPLVPHDYVHRVGRTGRAGAKGRAVSFVSPAERGLLAGIQRLLPSPIEQSVVKGFEPVRDAAPAAPRSGPAGRRQPWGRPRAQGAGGFRPGRAPHRDSRAAR